MSSEEVLTAIVTGGAQGIGHAICDALLSRGYKVCIGDVNESVGNETKEEFSKKYGPSSVIFVTCDVTKESDFTKVFEEALRTFGRIDVLVSNAGIACEEDPEKTIMVNLYGPMLGCKAAMTFMGKDNGGKGGSVVNVASLAGLMPFFLCPFYSATKHGVVGLTRSFGTPFHYDKHGITFHALCPGYVRTAILKNIESIPNEELQSIIQRIGIIQPEFAAEGVIKLLDDKRNGATLMVTKQQGFKYIGIGEDLKTVALT